MTDETSLKKFVSKTMKDIESALPKDAHLAGSVNFDVAVAVQKSRGGKFNINILGADAHSSKVTTQRISFPVSNKKTADEAVKMMRRLFREMYGGLKELDKPKRRKNR